MLYAWDWAAQELRDFERGLVPAHHLFGGAELPAFGVSVVICRWRLVPERFRRRRVWKVWQALWVTCIQRRLDCIIATTEAPALPALLLRRIGALRVPIIVLSVAVLTGKYRRRGPAGWLRRWLLRGAARVVVYASAQVPLVSQQLGVQSDRTCFVPLGIDVEFFRPEPSPPPPRWEVISVGANEGKDFETLLGALCPGQRCLVVTDGPHRQIVSGIASAGLVTVNHNLPIARVRELYALARRQVIPLKDVEFSSGQTVLLENLAMGRPVVISDVAAVRDYVAPGIVTLVPPGDPDALRQTLSSPPPEPYVPLAAKHVREHFSSRRFAQDLAALCRDVTRNDAQPSETVGLTHAGG